MTQPLQGKRILVTRPAAQAAALAHLVAGQGGLAVRFPQLVAKDADLAVRMVLEAMAAALVRGDRIETRGFGSFESRRKPPRIGRNPRSGEKVQVPAKYVPHFKAGKELRECVNRRD